MGFLKKIANTKFGGKLLGGYISGKVNKEVESVAEHFEHFLEPILAKNEQHRNESHRIRHSVYCEELKFEDEKPSKLEIDDFDKFSLISLIRHKPNSNFAGTVRVVCPQHHEQLLPIQKYCSQGIGSINTLFSQKKP